MDIMGRVKLQKIQLSSGVNYNAEDLESQECIAEINSGSFARVSVSDSLDAEINSGASLEYSGDPELIQDVSSGGNIKKVNK